MSYFRSQNLDNILTGMFLAAAIGATAMVAAPDTAQALSPPPKGSEQWNLLAPYKDFIVNMRRASGGSCCDMGDGRGNFEEHVETRYNADGEVYNHYKVTLDPEAFGLPSGPEITIDIPRDAVLMSDHAEKVCEPVRDRAFQQGKEHTCYRPIFNVVWAVPTTQGGGYDNTGKGWHVYCYIPRAQMG